jgi:hypothetical protein
MKPRETSQHNTCCQQLPNTSRAMVDAEVTRQHPQKPASALQRWPDIRTSNGGLKPVDQDLARSTLYNTSTANHQRTQRCYNTHSIAVAALFCCNFPSTAPRSCNRTATSAAVLTPASAETNHNCTHSMADCNQVPKPTALRPIRQQAHTRHDT